MLGKNWKWHINKHKARKHSRRSSSYGGSLNLEQPFSLFDSFILYSQQSTTMSNVSNKKTNKLAKFKKYAQPTKIDESTRRRIIRTLESFQSSDEEGTLTLLLFSPFYEQNIIWAVFIFSMEIKKIVFLVFICHLWYFWLIGCFVWIGYLHFRFLFLFSSLVFFS